MRIEVDQSGKIGDTRVPTVMAFSNDESCAIRKPKSRGSPAGYGDKASSAHGMDTLRSLATRLSVYIL
jgi:hypothetical protein